MTAKNAGQIVASPGTLGQVAEFQDNPGKSGTVGKSDVHCTAFFDMGEILLPILQGLER